MGSQARTERLAVPQGAAGAGNLPNPGLRPNTPVLSSHQPRSHSRRWEPGGSRASPLSCSPNHYFPTSSSFCFFFLSCTLLHFFALAATALFYLYCLIFFFLCSPFQAVAVMATVMPQGWTSSPPAYEIHEERTSSLFKVLAVCSRDPVYLPEWTNCCEDLSQLVFEVMLTAAGFSFPAYFWGLRALGLAEKL